MPHLAARVPEARLAGHEPALITALTDAVVQVYGEWARDLVVVHLDGIPRGRWGVGGKAADDAAPVITFGIRETALARPDGPQIAARLVASLTDAVASVLEHRFGATSVGAFMVGKRHSEQDGGTRGHVGTRNLPGRPWPMAEQLESCLSRGEDASALCGPR